MASEPKKYELAYLLSPAVAEEEVLVVSGKLARMIEDAGGMIRHQETPQKRKLAFLVKKERNGYFGWTTFTAATEAIGALEKTLKAAENLLRHIIVAEKEIVQPVRTFMPRPLITPRTRPPAVPAERPEEKLDLEELDKKLEEILGK